MVPDDWIWTGIFAAILALASLLPFAYRFIAEQLAPFGVRLRFVGGLVQAGATADMHATIVNRTTSSAYFLISCETRAGVATLPTRFLHTWTYRHHPLNDGYSGLLRLGPLETDHVLIQVMPKVRGHYHFEVSIAELYHPSRFPRLVWLQRRIRPKEDPHLFALDYRLQVEFEVESWVTNPSDLRRYTGSDQTSEEMNADLAYGLNRSRQEYLR